MKPMLAVCFVLWLAACNEPSASSAGSAQVGGGDDANQRGSASADAAGSSTGLSAAGSASVARDYSEPPEPGSPDARDEAKRRALQDAMDFGMVGPTPTGFSWGPTPGSSATGPKPVVRVGATSVSGRLPPEVIQRIVRQNFGRFRLCYENGLRKDPNLTGKVSVSFVIGRDGSVGTVSSGPNTLPDAGVVACVTKAFYGLSFPEPEGGVVKVTYPIVFSPGQASSTWRVGGKTLEELTVAELEKALRELGCSDLDRKVAAGSKATTITGKYQGGAFTITFVPLSAEPDALSKDARARLKQESSFLEQGGFFLAVERGEPARDEELFKQLVKAS